MLPTTEIPKFFLSNRGTDLATLTARPHVHECAAQNLHVLALFLDFVGAFDRVHRYIYTFDPKDPSQLAGFFEGFGLGVEHLEAFIDLITITPLDDAPLPVTKKSVCIYIVFRLGTKMLRFCRRPASDTEQRGGGSPDRHAKGE